MVIWKKPSTGGASNTKGCPKMLKIGLLLKTVRNAFQFKTSWMSPKRQIFQLSWIVTTIHATINCIQMQNYSQNSFTFHKFWKHGKSEALSPNFTFQNKVQAE